jgi:hypothetical protein
VHSPQAAGAAAIARTGPAPVALVIVDIGGYTRFIRANRTTLVHAQEIVALLLENVIDNASYPLTLNKLEGDAAFLYAELGDDPAAAVRDVARLVDAFFAGFHARARELAGSRATCPCDACRRIGGLQLKAIAHAGQAAFRRIRQFEELAGEDVILVHRLLKNTVAESEYVMMTEPFFALLADATNLGADARSETCEGFGAVSVRVCAPGLLGPSVNRFLVQGSPQ